MLKRSLRDSRLVALFILGCVALFHPLVSLFSRDAAVFGIPVLYLYLYGIWAALVVLAWLVAAGRKGGGREC
jgi:uncharacterized membrane-anchored protein